MDRKKGFLRFAILTCCILSGCNGARPTPDIRLTKDATGQVTSIVMVGKYITDSDLKDATKHTQVTELKLQECSKVTNKGLGHFKGSFPQLKSLELVRVPVNDSSLADLSNSQSLADLTLAHTNVTGQGLKHLVNCPIKRIAIFSRVVTADGMKNLGMLKGLEELELHCQDSNMKDLVAISELKKLKKLVAFRTPVGRQGLEVLRGLDQLQWLHLNSSDIDDESIEVLNTLTSLEWAEFDDGTLTNEGIKRLQLPKLKQFSLDGCRGITDEGLSNFTGMPAIESLMLGGTGVAGIDLTPLSSLPNLKEVRLMGNQFRGNEESIRALKAKLPKCEVVIMRG